MLIPLDVKNALDNIPEGSAKDEILIAYYKSIPKIVVKNKKLEKELHIHAGNCPTCKKLFVDAYGTQRYCSNCGQKILFSK